jgi:hypothetical protein
MAIFGVPLWASISLAKIVIVGCEGLARKYPQSASNPSQRQRERAEDKRRNNPAFSLMCNACGDLGVAFTVILLVTWLSFLRARVCAAGVTARFVLQVSVPKCMLNGNTTYLAVIEALFEVVSMDWLID